MIMQDLTQAPEVDTSDPSGSLKEYGNYTLSWGLAASAIGVGVALIGGPLKDMILGATGQDTESDDSTVDLQLGA